MRVCELPKGLSADQAFDLVVSNRAPWILLATARLTVLHSGARWRMRRRARVRSRPCQCPTPWSVRDSRAPRSRLRVGVVSRSPRTLAAERRGADGRMGVGAKRGEVRRRMGHESPLRVARVDDRAGRQQEARIVFRKNRLMITLCGGRCDLDADRQIFGYREVRRK